jgi:uncharacterized membrane protein
VTKAIVRARPTFTSALAWAAITVGVAARVFSLVFRPLWADEIFTLTVARKSVPEILAALRVDSGPPLHYLFAYVLLAPFPAPGLADVFVRLLSFAASLLHLPLLFAVARRLGREEMGLRAAALYSVFPLAVAYAAEGRAYALASLLALLAFERALALRETPRPLTALVLTLAAAGAVLSHYLAVFPVAALAILAFDARPVSRRALVLSGLAAAALAATWMPIALAQPHASMKWSRDVGFASALRDFPANLAFGAPAGGPAMVALGVAGAVVLVALLTREWRGVLAPVARVLGLSLALLALAELGVGDLVLPERTALVFLPFFVLLVAAAPPFVPLAVGTLATALLALWLPRAAEPSPGALLARLLEAPARAGRLILAAGSWGPELDYRLQRAGTPGRVLLFPSAVAAHPGWYHEEEIPNATLEAEAEAVLSVPRAPTLFILPRGLRASAAIASRLGHARRLLSSPLVDVVETRPAAAAR